MEEYKRNEQDLYANTDNGLDILKKYIPDFVLNKNFCYREEKNPSARAYKSNTGIWYIKDFGGGSHFPLQIVMEQMGLSYYDALVHLYAEFQIPVSGRASLPQNKTFKEKGDLPNDYFNIAVKNITNEKEFSRFVTPELLLEFNIYEVEYYERITSNGKLMRVDSTPYYPIFVYSPDITQWAKLYCPAEKKGKTTLEDGTEKRYNYKHGYLGKKPEKYFHGLDRIKAKYSEEKIKAIDNYREILKRTSDKEVKAETQKALDDMLLPYVIICSGGSDGVSIASLSSDFYPVWGNSESDIITEDVYSFLKKISKNLIYLPDVDKAGIEFAYAYSHRYWKLDVAILPDYYLKDGSGKIKGKDFRDYLKHKEFTYSEPSYIAKKFKELLNVSVNCNFITLNDRKQYRINPRNLYYFLNTNNFFTYEPEFSSDKTPNETNDIIIHINKHKIEIPTSKQIRQFCSDFLIRKGTKTDILTMLENTNALRVADLVKLPNTELNFKNYDKDYQLYFFENTAVKIDAKQIKTIGNKDISCSVWDSNVIKNNFSLEKPFFEMYQDEKGHKRVKILNSKCDFLSFIINTSRVFWEKESEKNKDFRKNRVLNSPYLTEEEQITQEQHFLGKCFAIGYLLHRYKKRGFEKYVYIMDDKVKESVTENNGRTGKGLMVNAIAELAPYFYRGGKNSNLFQDKHIFGTYKGQPIIYFDDMHASIPFSEVYTFVSEGITINEKTKGDYHIPYEKAPKLVGTYNHAIRNMTSSDLGRILFVTFSDYYFFSSDKKFQPNDDFGKSFFQDWDNKEYNLFYNFMLQCLQFFLQNMHSPVLSPTENLQINTLKASIGDNFLEWAEVYFVEEHLNKYISREEMYSNYASFVGKIAVIPTKFKKNLEMFCQLKGYVFNPIKLRNSQGRIIKEVEKIGGGRTSREHFYISSVSSEIDLPTSEPTSEPTSANNTTIDECDFWADNEDLKF